jgi:hypothetical protein
MVRAIGEAVGRPTEAEALAKRLDGLDARFAEGLADCDRKAFVTSHAAFGYLARRYGLEQVALAGLSPEAEPSPQALESLVDEVRRTGATTVFFETLVPSDLAHGDRRLDAERRALCEIGDPVTRRITDVHGPGTRPLEPEDEPHQRRLAAAVRARDRDELARLDAQRHVLEHVGAAWVGERHAVERDPYRHPSAARSARRFDCIAVK